MQSASCNVIYNNADVSPTADTTTVVTMILQSHLVPLRRSFSDYCSSLKGFIYRNVNTPQLQILLINYCSLNQVSKNGLIFKQYSFFPIDERFPGIVCTKKGLFNAITYHPTSEHNANDQYIMKSMISAAKTIHFTEDSPSLSPCQIMFE